MHIKQKNIGGKEYRYAARSIRMPNGKIASLEKRYTNQTAEEIKSILDEKEREAYYRYALSIFKPDHILNEEEIRKIEDIRLNYHKVLKRLSKASLKDLLDRFVANFTYESNALEGNSLTLKDVAIVMFENAAVKGKSLREVYETRNSREVIELIMQNKFSISSKGIIRMHRMLVRDIDVEPGYKKVPSIIIGRERKTTPPEKVQEEMDKLIAWYEKSKGSMHPIKLAALFHGRFEMIHPFEDGNGRVGRFIINVILAEQKYPPLIIRNNQRLSYLCALEKFDTGHTDSLERFLLMKFKETFTKFFEIYIRYIK